MKGFSKLFGIIALVAIIGFSMVACDNDPEGSNPDSGTNWNGVYTYLSDQLSTLDLNAGTITGGSDTTSSTYGTYNADLVIENVSLGEVHTLPTITDQYGSYSGKWAYVYRGDDKIGLIYSTNSSISAMVNYEIRIDKNSSMYGIPYYTQPENQPENLDMSDVVDIQIWIAASKFIMK